MTYVAPATARPAHWGTTVTIHYEMYAGIPVMCKYLEFENTTGQPIDVDHIETELLALQQDQLQRLHMESDYSHALFNRDVRASDTQHLTGDKIHEFMSQGTTTKWRIESGYRFYATHNQHEDKLLGFPHHNLLVSTVPRGPDETVPPSEQFTSMHSFLLLHDSDDSERQAFGAMYLHWNVTVREDTLAESLLPVGLLRDTLAAPVSARHGIRVMSAAWQSDGLERPAESLCIRNHAVTWSAPPMATSTLLVSFAGED